MKKVKRRKEDNKRERKMVKGREGKEKEGWESEEKRETIMGKVTEAEKEEERGMRRKQVEEMVMRRGRGGE